MGAAVDLMGPQAARECLEDISFGSTRQSAASGAVGRCGAELALRVEPLPLPHPVGGCSDSVVVLEA